MRSDEGLVGAPAARGELLLGGEESEGVLHGLFVFGVAEIEVGTRSRAEGDDVRIGMLTGEWIRATGERIEEVTVEQVAFGEFAEGGIAGELRGSEEIFRHDVCLVVGRILLPNAIVDLGWEQWLGAGEDAVEEIRRERHLAEGCGVDEAREVFVERVADPQIRFGAQDALIIRTERGREALDQIVDLLMAG